MLLRRLLLSPIWNLLTLKWVAILGVLKWDKYLPWIYILFLSKIDLTVVLNFWIIYLKLLGFKTSENYRFWIFFSFFIGV